MKVDNVPTIVQGEDAVGSPCQPLLRLPPGDGAFARDEEIIKLLVSNMVKVLMPAVAKYAACFGVSRSFRLNISYEIEWPPEETV